MAMALIIFPHTFCDAAHIIALDGALSLCCFTILKDTKMHAALAASQTAEPTNYLDQETLGALVNALKKFKGGFLTVTHNEHFVREVCKERWYVEGGQVTPSKSS